MIFITICCLDQSTKSTGYSIWENGTLKKYGLIEVDKNEKNPVERIVQMYSKIRELLKKSKPDYVCLEEVQHQVNPHVCKTLAQLQGAIFASLFDLDIGFCIVEASCWKPFFGVTSKKRADQKLETIKIVKDKFNKDVSEDEADSIAIGYWAINNLTVNSKEK